MKDTTIGIWIGVYVALIVACFVGAMGWAMNLVKFVIMVSDHAPIDAFWIARLVGIPLPMLGAALGFF